jgi:chromosome segregation ATPase
MRVFGFHIPGTRDLQKENQLLRERLEMLEKEAQMREDTEKSLRQANHQLRMDLRQTNKMVDEWMAHYDELQRDLQKEKQKVVSMKMEMGKRGVELDPLQQMRELREGLRAEKGQAADHKPTLARQAAERLAREDGNSDSPKEKKGQEAEQARKPREKAKGMEMSL